MLNEENTQPKKRGRPPKEEGRKNRVIIQIRIDQPTLDRVLIAKSKTSVYGRCEFVRILIDEALKERGV